MSVQRARDQDEEDSPAVLGRRNSNRHQLQRPHSGEPVPTEEDQDVAYNPDPSYYLILERCSAFPSCVVGPLFFISTRETIKKRIYRSVLGLSLITVALKHGRHT